MLQSSSYVDNDLAKQLNPEQQKLWNEIFECRGEIQNILMKTPRMINASMIPEDADITTAAFLLAKACEYNAPLLVNWRHIIKDVDDKDILALIEKCKIEDSWKELVELTKKHERRVFCLVSSLINLSDPYATPLGVYELAIRILNLNQDDSFADLCCGSGNVTRLVADEFPEIKAIGYDVVTDMIGLAKVNNAFSGNKTEFHAKDVFRLVEDKPVFNKIFSNYPFGLNLKYLKQGVDFRDSLEKKIPSVSRGTSSDWMFNALIMELLDKKGKAVAIMSNGGTWNTLDGPIRKYFVEKGLIESVVALPAKLFGFTSIPVSLIVFSHGNKSIRLVDATQEFKPGRRVNELSDDNIEAILRSLKEDSDKSKDVSVEEFRDNEYVLSLGRYLNNPEEIKNGVRFEEVINRITRGAPLNAKELDKKSSAEPTEVQYLSLSNVRDGLIDSSLPYLKGIDEKDKKYCVNNHSIILSKNGYPYKIAVAEVKDTQTIMANGNLYLIELNEKKIDPYYLAAYLNSFQGIGALKNITVGVSIPNIGVEQLKNLVIPLPSLEEQKKIGEEYIKVRDEIALLQLKLEKAKDRLSQILKKGGE